MKIDWPSEWYRAWRDNGDDVSFFFGQMQGTSDHEEPRWFELRHEEFDGIGGFVHLLRSQGFRIDQLPFLRDDRLTLFRALRGLLAFIPMAKMRRQQWRQFDRTRKSRLLTGRDRVAWHIFTEEQTKKIISAAKAAGVSMNTYLLFHLDAAVASQLTAPSSIRRWCIPVNLRGAVSRPTELVSCVSYLGVDIGRDCSQRRLHQKIMRAKERGFHWGSWLGMIGGFLLGRDGMRRYFRTCEKKDHCWTGTFSNLGVWEVPGSGNWFVTSYIPRIYPVGAGSLMMNGRLSLTVRLHDGFGDDARTWKSLLESWKEACLNG